MDYLILLIIILVTLLNIFVTLASFFIYKYTLRQYDIYLSLYNQTNNTISKYLNELNNGN